MYSGIDVGNILRQSREASSLSISDLAKITGVSKSTIQRWEVGSIKTIPANMVKPLSAALGIAPWKLLGYESLKEFVSVPNSSS